MPGRIVQGLADRVVKYRVPVALSVIALTALLASRIPLLQANFTPEDLFARVEGQQAIGDAFQEAFGNTDNVVLVLVKADDVLSVPSLQYLHDVSRHFRGQDGIDQVSSITSTPLPRFREPEPETGQPGLDPGFGNLGGLFGVGNRSGGGAGGLADLLPNVQVVAVVEGEEVEPEEAEALRAILQDSPLVEGKLVSADRRVAAVVLMLDRDVRGNARVAEVVGGIADYVEAHPPPEGVQAMLAGLPYVRLVVVSKMRADQTLLLPAAVLVCLLILAFAFRWPAAVVLSTVAVGMSAAMVVGGMALAGEPVNIINNIVPMLVLIIGISSAIHLVNRFGEEYRATQRRATASRRSLRAMTSALFLTSFTTAVGFGSLAVSATPMLSRFGVTAAIGIMIAYVVSVTFLPASLTFVQAPRRWLGWKRQGRIEHTISWATRHVIRLRWPVLGASAALFAVALFLATNLEVNSAILDQLSEDDEIYRTTRLIEEHLEGMRALEVSLTSDREGRFGEPDVLNAMSRLQSWVEARDGVLGTTSYAELLHEAWYRLTGDPARREAPFDNAGLLDFLGGLMDRSGTRNPAARYVTNDRTEARINIQVADLGSRWTIDLIEAVEAELAERFGGLDEVDAALTGDAYIQSMGLTLVMRDLFTSLLTAFLIIFGFLAIVLRSWRLGLLSIPPNIIPLVGTMAYMVVRGIPLNLATVIIFSVSIGMAVDGTIHVLARFREEILRTDDVEQALVNAACGTGKAILFTCLSLMLGFGVMFLSSFPPVRRFGELIAVTMGSCLLATLIMVPALLRVSFPDVNRARAITYEHDVIE